MKRFKKPYRIKRRKSVLQNRFFWLSILIIIIVSVIFYLCCLSPYFQIENIKISGDENIQPKIIQSEVRRQLGRKILSFTSDSIFLVNFSEIRDSILRKFPQIASIDFKKSFPSTILIKVKEREPVAIFSSGKEYFLIDKEGVIFRQIFNLNHQKFLVIQKEVKNPMPGEKVIDQNDLSRILEIESKLKKNLSISLLGVSVASQDKLEAKTTEGWEIYFNFHKDVDWQILKLKLALQKKITPEDRKKLNYIDLRFDDQVYYKFITLGS